MSASFFFYDLETSGFNSRSARIMQFAGQRTDLNLHPVGEPENIMIKLHGDVLPDPDAVMVTGITPQVVNADGISEADFLRHFTNTIATPDTIFVGYNTVRFDDEFMRTLHYRNFYDPYEWQWQDGRSRWDILDVVRMTRALRPEGIEWPFDVQGKPTNRLELLTGINKLEHTHAHDALSDVEATIGIARLIRNKHTKLFDYLLSMRQKNKIADLVEGGQPFVYTSGKYPSEFDRTTVVATICPHPKRQAAFVYDLRHDPTTYLNKTSEELVELWRWKKDAEEPRLPVKTLQYNRCPAIAPYGVLDDKSRERIQINQSKIIEHKKILESSKDFEAKLCRAWELLENTQQTQTTLVTTPDDVDARIYDGFFDTQDKQSMRVVRAANPEELNNLGLQFHDDRLTALLPLYKARNYPASLTSEERTAWDAFCAQRLVGGGKQSRMAHFFTRLQEIAAREHLTSHQQYLIEELKLYAESILPEGTEEG